MGERCSVRVGDEVLEFKSLNLKELMKENDEDEILEDPAEDVSANRRQTMASILVADGSETPRGVIPSKWSKAWEYPRKCWKIAGSRALKNMFRVKKKFEEEEAEESANLLRAERSPSVVDSTRLRAAGGDGAAAIRVFLVGRSPSDVTDRAAANQGIPWRFLKRKLRLKEIASSGSSRREVAVQSNLNSAVPVVLPPAEESDEAVSSNNPGPLQQHDGNIDGRNTSETGGDTNESRAGSGENAESPANSSLSDLPAAAGGRRQAIPSSFDGHLQEPGGSIRAGMNLAAALAAERQMRAAQDWSSVGSAGGSRGFPFRVSLMSLLEEADERICRSKATTASALLTDKWEEAQRQSTEGVEPSCCVCMVRPKGAAFIPCGHTFCRFCSREIRVIRGWCPLCNTRIMEILDIFKYFFLEVLSFVLLGRSSRWNNGIGEIYREYVTCQ